MIKSNKHRNRKNTVQSDIKNLISYKRFKFRENKKGVINHSIRNRKINNIINDDLN